VSGGRAWNAASVGAHIVKGPACARIGPTPVAASAVVRVVYCPSVMRVSGMFCRATVVVVVASVVGAAVVGATNVVGTSTWSITYTMSFDAGMLRTILAVLTVFGS